LKTVAAECSPQSLSDRRSSESQQLQVDMKAVEKDVEDIFAGNTFLKSR